MQLLVTASSACELATLTCLGMLSNVCFAPLTACFSTVASSLYLCSLTQIGGNFVGLNLFTVNLLLLC